MGPGDSKCLDVFANLNLQMTCQCAVNAQGMSDNKAMRSNSCVLVDMSSGISYERQAWQVSEGQGWQEKEANGLSSYDKSQLLDSLHMANE